MFVWPLVHSARKLASFWSWQTSRCPVAAGLRFDVLSIGADWIGADWGLGSIVEKGFPMDLCLIVDELSHPSFFLYCPGVGTVVQAPMR